LATGEAATALGGLVMMVVMMVMVVAGGECGTCERNQQ
jgi:hypothetical protein